MTSPRLDPPFGSTPDRDVDGWTCGSSGCIAISPLQLSPVRRSTDRLATSRENRSVTSATAAPRSPPMTGRDYSEAIPPTGHLGPRRRASESAPR
jgi:hypothetical protein